ncbi:TetR/AcrR family transcriptional regulator C-terminal domain-containing protein [Lysobacter arvi]|uniref:TetR/AcrR family transcriptional regulator C-terminal domain-containing protein n=1 Tax=Lysobacter arvi TaxID=3038776 RepID=A0ABU1C9Z7_9GAMM|nr:TetR/AcrR family transcriptional regulator C-terminal domain-containing protein [Lysobacter arvi]MDR0182014.1 TetR/AcrR family transcriptional regulator C-terminal domain-containing protein [Lysobacter arvi]
MFAAAHATSTDPREALRAWLVQKVVDVLHSRCADTFGAVLQMATVSRSDVIAAFGHDGALFVAVVRATADRILAPLSERPTGSSFHPQLIAFARQATEWYSGPGLSNLYRVAVASEFGAYPVRADFYRQGPARVRDELARFMSFAKAQGFGPDMDCRRAAVHFLSLLRTYWDAADASSANDQAHVDEDLDWMVEVFLYGVQARSGHAFPSRHAPD